MAEPEVPSGAGDHAEEDGGFFGDGDVLTAPPRRPRSVSRRLWDRLELRPAPPPGTRDRISLRAAVVILALTVVLSYLFVGAWFVVLTFALAVVTVRFNPDPGRPFAFATFALVIAAALATIVLVPLKDTDPTIQFATSRSLASQFGSYAGVFLAIATMMYAVAERSEHAEIWHTSPHARPAAAIERITGRVPAAIGGWAPFAATGTLAVAARVAASPTALSPALDPLVRSFQFGTGPMSAAGGGTPLGDQPPLGIAVAAYSPVGPRVSALLVSLAVVALATWIAWRHAGRTAALSACVLVSVFPPAWDQRLPTLLASAFVLAAIGLADPRRLTVRRAVGAGLLCGMAALSRLDAVVAVPALAMWPWILGSGSLGVRRRETVPAIQSTMPTTGRADGELTRWAAVAAFVVSAAFVMAPWFNYTWSNFGVSLGATSTDAVLRDPAGAGRLPSLVALATTGALLAAIGLGLMRSRPDLRRHWPLVVLPGACLLTGVAIRAYGDLLSWSAPIACALAALLLATVTGKATGAAATSPTARANQQPPWPAAT